MKKIIKRTRNKKKLLFQKNQKQEKAINETSAIISKEILLPYFL